MIIFKIEHFWPFLNLEYWLRAKKNLSRRRLLLAKSHLLYDKRLHIVNAFTQQGSGLPMHPPTREGGYDALGAKRFRNRSEAQKLSAKKSSRILHSSCKNRLHLGGRCGGGLCINLKISTSKKGWAKLFWRAI